MCIIICNPQPKEGELFRSRDISLAKKIGDGLGCFFFFLKRLISHLEPFTDTYMRYILFIFVIKPHFQERRAQGITINAKLQDSDSSDSTISLPPER